MVSDLDSIDVRTYSPLALAYIGDAIFDLIVRTKIIESGNAPVSTLHKKTVKYVSARSQHAMVKAIYEEFTEEEKDIFRRGKNTKMHTVAKNATITEYRYATGFEAVLGNLYLKDDKERLFYLINKAMDSI